MHGIVCNVDAFYEAFDVTHRRRLVAGPGQTGSPSGSDPGAGNRIRAFESLGLLAAAAATRSTLRPIPHFRKTMEPPPIQRIRLITTRDTVSPVATYTRLENMRLDAPGRRERDGIMPPSALPRRLPALQGRWQQHQARRRPAEHRQPLTPPFRGGRNWCVHRQGTPLLLGSPQCPDGTMLTRREGHPDAEGNWSTTLTSALAAKSTGASAADGAARPTGKPVHRRAGL